MTGPELFERWAPPGALWSRWAKPMLFAEWPGELFPAAAAEDLPPLELPRADRQAVVVDLPGAAAVKTGLALAQIGYRPVPLFNGAPGPSGQASVAAVIDVGPLVRALADGATRLETLALTPEARPAFLLDSRRQAPELAPLPGRFDNRWLVFPQDFPSANCLRSQRLEQVLLLQSAGREQPAADLAHVLRRWQEGGLKLFVQDAALGPVPRRLAVGRPSGFRALWYRALAMLRMRRNSAGGFGSIVPQPGSGG